MRNLDTILPPFMRMREWETIITRGQGYGDARNGAFACEMPRGDTLRIIAANAHGWDHVSVSLVHRCPIWAEMELVKRAFFLPHETAMQLHPAVSEYVNHHAFTLHIWRPHLKSIPKPPSIFVGPKPEGGAAP